MQDASGSASVKSSPNTTARTLVSLTDGELPRAPNAARSRGQRLATECGTVPSMRDWDLVPFPDLSAETLAGICTRHDLPAVTGRLDSNGAINSIWLLGDELVLRVPKNMDEGWKDTLTESVAAPVAHTSGMRTPALVVFDETLELVDVPYTVYERVRGEAGGPAAPAGWRELGREVALLHSAVTGCPDPLDRLDDAGRWTDADALVAFAVNGIGVEGELRRRIEAEVRRVHPAVCEAMSFTRFLHNDLHQGNLMADGAEHVAVIDWGDAGWGDPAKEMSNLPVDGIAPFVDGYREVMPFDGDASIDDRIRWDAIVDALNTARPRDALQGVLGD
jgi:aminoglycoside phosphotransferase (APT) family kinase protein